MIGHLMMQFLANTSAMLKHLILGNTDQICIGYNNYYFMLKVNCM